jgi:hypothetical protein
VAHEEVAERHEVGHVRRIEEHVAVPEVRVPDRELVREVANRATRRLAEDQPRILVSGQAEVRIAGEVGALLALGAKPCQRRVREHAVEHHQPLNCALDRGRATEPVVGVADCHVEGLVVEVIEAYPATRTEGGGTDPAEGLKALQEVVDLLPVGDAGERRVLAADEDAGVADDEVNEAALAGAGGRW